MDPSLFYSYNIRDITFVLIKLGVGIFWGDSKSIPLQRKISANVHTYLRRALFTQKFFTNKMLLKFHSSNGKLVRTGEEFWFPDDVTLGYIIGK